MAVGRRAKDLIGPLLVVNLVMYLVVLGLAAWSLDKYINGEQNHPHLGGNPATSFMLMFALLASVVGVCSVPVGLAHLRAWRSDSLAGASPLAIFSWAVTALAFGLVCKEIILGGHRGKRLVRVLIRLGHYIYGPGYRSHGDDHGGDAPPAPEQQTIGISEV